jgi:hypothetical protein
MTHTTESVLDDLFELLKDPEHWTKGALARPADDGMSVPPLDSRATRWCLAGAAIQVSHSPTLDHFRVQEEVIALLEHQLPSPHKSLESFNDASIHDQVLDLIDVVRKSLREPC